MNKSVSPGPKDASSQILCFQASDSTQEDFTKITYFVRVPTGVSP